MNDCSSPLRGWVPWYTFHKRIRKLHYLASQAKIYQQVHRRNGFPEERSFDEMWLAFLHSIFRFYKSFVHWQVFMKCNKHNHDAAEIADRLPAVKTPTPDDEAQFSDRDAQHKCPGSAQLASWALFQFICKEPGALQHPEDINNARHLRQAEAFGGRTPTHQFLRELQADSEA